MIRKIDKYIALLPLFLIRIYKLISAGSIPCCRFYPSCSNYASAAFEKRGFAAGFVLTLKRLAKCHPFNSGGVDLAGLEE